MAKAKMVCPFSGGRCVECALFRGRHQFLCFSKYYNEHQEDLEDLWNQRRAKASDNGNFGMPDEVPQSSHWISDVEEFLERREE